ncbi:response regulator transcription factor [Salinibacterium sp. SYSU T00001]|uniref:response regulator n=1 Tax=Homoserinimonas sedimenticola TaxID=2986805 RepID=UPI00223619C3|nr:response regulator transcription factor [Salinibacterium sedimenticola]MCW4385583.1 response regulator transcription factor [Salinibacterium sedimenticola]
MTRVLLVDDQDLVRAGFRTILQSEPGIEVVGEAASGADAIDRARELQPDVICMDVQMPGMDGLEATRMLVADASVAAGVLILTTFDRDDYLFEALQAGASGFLLKNARAEELIDAVQIVARGDALLSPSVTRRVIARFAGDEPAAPAAITNSAAVRDLTERELEVLGLIAAGLSNSEIAAKLYVGEATVKTHVSKVLMKLGLRDRIQAVIFAYEHGLAG